MTTMAHKHVTATVVYIDPSATGANDGTTPDNAKTTLPTIGTLAASTVYLIRRGSVLTVAPGTSSSKHGLGIIGMPKSTDALYDAVPAEAKTAWDADAAEYAQLNFLLNATTTAFNTTNGLTLFRLDCVSTQTIASPAVPFFTFTTVNMLCVEKCRSRINNIDLAGMVTYNVANNKSLTSWLFSSCIGLSIKSCWFDRPYSATATGIYGTSANGQCCVVDVVACGDIYINDCDFYAVFGGNSCSGYVNSAFLALNTTVHESVVLKDLRFKVIEIRDASLTSSGTAPYSWSPCIGGIVNKATVSGITITAKKIGTQTPSSAWAGVGDSTQSPYVHFYCVNLCNVKADDLGSMFGVDITDVNIDLTGLSFAFCGMRLCGSSASYSDTHYSGRWLVKNFTFLAPQATAGGNNSGSPVLGSGVIGLNIGCCHDITVDTVDIRYTGANFIAIDYGGLCEYGVAITSGTEYYNMSGGLVNVTVVGFVSMASGFADIRSITVPFATSYPAVNAAGGSQVYIDNLVLPSGYSTTENPVSSRENSQILVKSVNMVGNWATSLAAEVNNHIAVANADGAVGAWKSYSGYAYAITTAVYRTGGAAAALFMKTPSAPARIYGPWLAPFPYAAKAIDPGGTGRRILNVYIATRGFTTIYRKIFASLQILIESSSGVYPKKREYLSTTDGWMAADATSVWVNDSGLTAFKISVPFLVDRYENVGVRIHFVPEYENAAYLYLDPKLEIVAG